jgi:sec-independent protein translocase protein TatA
MGSLGVPELLVIFVVILIFFGPKKLPEVGRSIGKTLNEFKKASNDLRNTLEEEIRIDERRQAAPAPRPAPAAPLPVIDATASVAPMVPVVPEPAPLAPAPEPAPQDVLAETVARGQHGS